MTTDVTTNIVSKEKTEKKTVEKTKKVSRLKSLKHSWKKIKFLSKKQVAKRFGLVALIMTILALFIVGIDYALTNGMTLLSEVSFDLSVVKTILSVVFLILCIVLIVVEVFRKSNTKGFSAPKSNVHTINDAHSKIIRIISICMFVLLIAMYIM